VNDLAILPSTNVKIWETKMCIVPSIAHWKGINLLGADYLRKANLMFECSYNYDY